jgi:two-component system, NtrC family, nitrogen regulation sensor histidine kinase NtrY
MLRRFNILVIIRVTLLVANVIVIASIFGDKRLFFNQIILGTILIIQIAELLRFVNHTNRELSRFFLAIKHSDFSITFKQRELGKSFSELQESMIEIIDAYQKVKIEKEAQFHFLQMLVNHLRIGLIAVEKESVNLINPTAEDLLGIHGLRNWTLLHQVNPRIAKDLETLGDNGRKLIEVRTAAGHKFLSVDVSTMIILDKSQKLITLQDINSEIEQKEIEAWHKLIRILTHEIMNSVTPISSLTETMQSLLEDKEGNQKELASINSENISDIRFALQTIQKRSEGLLQFIENYRKLTRVPKPKFEIIDLSAFLKRIETLMINELRQKGIIFEMNVDPRLNIKADPVLVEQVVINLLTNSIHALHNRKEPKITLTAFARDPHVILEVKDNGKGISEKEIGEIFTPFFSTRKDGSGIGLSLSKQIMSLHHGSIKATSEVNVGTSILLEFKTTF